MAADKWMFALKHIHELAEKPAAFHEAEFERLFLLAKIGNFTPDEYKQYITSLQRMSDYYNIIDTAVEAAEKRGREEGRAEGREKGKREIASRLISMGMSDDDIIIATGLSTDELAELKTE
ncbi:MAG: PD-(D/E)XK nuclease family transposase [Bacteroidales bacterium]|nr:PD-(D/E)XK nuclease family transposase [Bacteroidales bacterium]